MRRKYKVTGCARFFLFLLIFTPIVLIGVSYYNGDDPIQKIKDFFGSEKTEQTIGATPTNDMPAVSTGNSSESSEVSESSILQGRINVMQNKIDQLEKENKDLIRTVQDRDKEILLLKQNK